MKTLRTLFQRQTVRSAPEDIRLPSRDSAMRRAPRTGAAPAHPQHGTMRSRVAVLLAVLAFPAVAAPGDFGAMAGAAPIESESVTRELAAMPAMDFERPGMSFPGSAYFYLDDPEGENLVALPTTDPLNNGGEAGHTLGQLIDAGPAANPFFASASGTSLMRAQQCLAQAIWYEAASESEAGQRAVAQVVLNRVAHRSWPGSVCGVVYQGSQRSTGCQFSFTCDGSLSRKAKGTSWRKAQRLASDALAGSVYAPVGHATHYHTLWVNPVWASSLDHIGTIGAHRFYRNRGLNGEKSAFTSGYTGAEPSVSARSAATSLSGTETLPLTNSAPQIDYDAPVSTADRSRAAIQNAPGSAANTAMPAQVDNPTPAYGAAGSVKSEYSQAGRWKKRPKNLDLPAANPQD